MFNVQREFAPFVGGTRNQAQGHTHTSWASTLLLSCPGMGCTCRVNVPQPSVVAHACHSSAWEAELGQPPVESRWGRAGEGKERREEGKEEEGDKDEEDRRRRRVVRKGGGGQG